MSQPVPGRTRPGRPAGARARDPAASGGTTRLSRLRWRRPRTADAGRSTRVRRPPTAYRAPTTSRRGCSRTFSRGSRRCRATASTARPVGTARACTSRSASRRSSGCPARRTSRRTGSPSSTRACRESVERHVDEFEAMTERMGYWVDVEHAYQTMDPTYIESVWWSLKQIFDARPAVRGAARLPVLSALRDHALRPRARAGLRDGDRPVGLRPVPAHVRAAGRRGRPAGLDHDALDAGVQHRGRRPPRRRLRRRHRRHRVAGGRRAAARAVLGEGWRVVASYPGREMERWTYERPFDLVDFPAPAHYVVLADYVTTDDGTGLVHQSPAFGARRPRGVPARTACRSSTRCWATATSPTTSRWSAASSSSTPTRTWCGSWSTVACCSGTWPSSTPTRTAGGATPRCSTTRLPAWYIRTTDVKDALLRENERTSWYPETIKWGRYGDWLRNNVDWSLSRTRYWGTPLPIWRCEAGPSHLRRLAGRARRAGRVRPERARPAPAVRRRRRRSAALHGVRATTVLRHAAVRRGGSVR